MTLILLPYARMENYSLTYIAEYTVKIKAARHRKCKPKNKSGKWKLLDKTHTYQKNDVLPQVNFHSPN